MNLQNVSLLSLRERFNQIISHLYQFLNVSFLFLVLCLYI